MLKKLHNCLIAVLITIIAYLKCQQFHKIIAIGFTRLKIFQLIRLQPIDASFFEVLRFRVRPPRQREKPLVIKCTMKIAGSAVCLRNLKYIFVKVNFIIFTLTMKYM